MKTVENVNNSKAKPLFFLVKSLFRQKTTVLLNIFNTRNVENSIFQHLYNLHNFLILRILFNRLLDFFGKCFLQVTLPAKNATMQEKRNFFVNKICFTTDN